MNYIIDSINFFFFFVRDQAQAQLPLDIPFRIAVSDDDDDDDDVHLHLSVIIWRVVNDSSPGPMTGSTTDRLGQTSDVEGDSSRCCYLTAD